MLSFKANRMLVSRELEIVVAASTSVGVACVTRVLLASGNSSFPQQFRQWIIAVHVLRNAPASLDLGPAAHVSK